MAKILRQKLNKEYRKFGWQILLKEIRKIKSVKDLRKFLNRFFTANEKILLLRRLAITKLLTEGKKYREIKDLLDTSGNTISGTKEIIRGTGYREYKQKSKR